MTHQDLWEKAVQFHGHQCGGLLIGFKAAIYAMELLDIEFSENEDIVCIAENDACGIDAIQAILGCSVGKGNLLFHMCGKQAFSFYNRATGRSVRIALEPRGSREDMEDKDFFSYYVDKDPADMMRVSETRIRLPEEARIFESYPCDCCGEDTAANWIRLAGDRKLCLDCYGRYNRFEM